MYNKIYTICKVFPANYKTIFFHSTHLAHYKWEIMQMTKNLETFKKIRCCTKLPINIVQILVVVIQKKPKIYTKKIYTWG